MGKPALQSLGAIAAQIVDSIAYPAAPENLYAPIRYTMSAGGKRLRPLLTLASAATMGGDPAAATAAATAIEMFHNSTLLHDDVMDNSDTRRGKPTVHKKWDTNTAILSGDAMILLSYKLLADIDPANLPSALACFTDTAIEICEGQQLDLDFETTDEVSVDQYVEMVRLKTSVMLGAAAKLGAICAGASQAEQQLAYDFGINLGVAFQLQDDYLDTFGDPAIFGKKIGGDIVSRKKTYLAIKARETATGAAREKLRQLAGPERPDNTTLVAETISIYKQLGIDQLTQNEIDRYFGKATATLAQLRAGGRDTTLFEELRTLVMGRKN